MGSPVSPIVANLYMEEIEEQAINLTQTPPKTWKRYVDDVFVIMKGSAVSTFHDQLNSIDPYISFTIEHERDGQIAFLDTLISHNNGTITTKVYRKPTHTDRYLHFDSHHDKKHKISTAATLLHRASHLPNTEEGKAHEIRHVTEALKSNGYPSKFISNVNKRLTKKKVVAPTTPEELVGQFFALVDPPTTRNGYAVLPYIKGLTEPLTRVLRKHDIKVFNKPLKTLQQEFPSPKDRPTTNKQTNVVYKINCEDCSWSYIGETGRCFETRKKEHIRNVKTYKVGSNIATHAWANDHRINFAEGQVIDRGSYRTRKTLESWHTALTIQADNNSKPLPEQYSIILKN